MVVDCSGLIALLQDEPQAESILQVIGTAERVSMSAATWVETSLVVGGRRGRDGLADLDCVILVAGIKIVPVDAKQASLAREAFMRFGKGRHRAALNLGDCFSYALAKLLNEPLLYIGRDFALTDIRSALPKPS